jgi:hypothetical protein
LHGAIIITLVKIHAGLQAWIESYSNKWCICDMTSRWQKLRRKPKLPSTNRTARIRLVRHNSDTRFVLQNLFKKNNNYTLHSISLQCNTITFYYNAI